MSSQKLFTSKTKLSHSASNYKKNKQKHNPNKPKKAEDENSHSSSPSKGRFYYPRSKSGPLRKRSTIQSTHQEYLQKRQEESGQQSEVRGNKRTTTYEQREDTLLEKIEQTMKDPVTRRNCKIKLGVYECGQIATPASRNHSNCNDSTTICVSDTNQINKLYLDCEALVLNYSGRADDNLFILILNSVNDKISLNTLKHDSKTKIDMLASSSHELRTPINSKMCESWVFMCLGIISALELLENFIDSDGKEYFKMAEINSKFISNLVNDVLVNS